MSSWKWEKTLKNTKKGEKQPYKTWKTKGRKKNLRVGERVADSRGKERAKAYYKYSEVARVGNASQKP